MNTRKRYDHIVMISLDTLRADCIAANPVKLWPEKYDINVVPRTRWLDQIIDRSAFFGNCIASAPYTSAAHASIFTGKWPLHHGVYEFFNRKLGCRTIFSSAKEAGYKTIFKTDFPIILGSYLGFSNDIEHYFIEDDEAVLRTIDNCPQSFCFVHFGGIHMPYGYHSLQFGGKDYQHKVSELEMGISGKLEGLPTDRLVETYRDPEDLDLLLRYKRIVQHYYSRRDYNKLFQLYLEGIDYFMQKRFEPFMEKLMALLKNKNYLIVIFGDHGEEYDADSYGHHNSLSEGVLRVPVLFLGKDVLPGVYQDRIRSIDIAPTLFDGFEGAMKRLRDMDGRSLADTVWGGQPYSVLPAFAQAYTSDAIDFVKYQARLLKTGKKRGTLRHVKYKEAVYLDDVKLHCQYYHYTEKGGIHGLEPCTPQYRLENIDSNYALRTVEAPDKQRELLAMLVDYEQAKGREVGIQINPKRKMLMELRNLGYKV